MHVADTNFVSFTTQIYNALHKQGIGPSASCLNLPVLSDDGEDCNLVS